MLRVLVLGPILANCGDTTGSSDSGAGNSGSAGDGTGTASGSADTDGNGGSTATDSGGDGAAENKVDILFVIDNSGSMGSRQRGLVDGSIDELLGLMEADGVEYRIAVTTTDTGNVLCPGTAPEAGQFEDRSCRARLEEFVFMKGDESFDVQQEACTDLCALDALEMKPTGTELDATPKPRPWLEPDNLPDGVTMSEALRCLLPQGVSGCGFEEPLESMHLAVQRATTSDQEEYGFLRSDALFAVVVLTDEVDCSVTPTANEIFMESNQTFWTDPEEATSAICWNAGVSCSGSGPTYDGCDPVNKDVNGNEGVADENAVLHPVSRYVELLSNLEQPTLFAAIAGVPEGYAQGEPIVYEDTQDSGFQTDFGIGPGCTSDMDEAAVPPVRMRVLEEQTTGERMLYSICRSNYDSAMVGIGNAIISKLP